MKSAIHSSLIPTMPALLAFLAVLALAPADSARADDAIGLAGIDPPLGELPGITELRVPFDETNSVEVVLGYRLETEHQAIIEASLGGEARTSAERWPSMVFDRTGRVRKRLALVCRPDSTARIQDVTLVLRMRASESGETLVRRELPLPHTFTCEPGMGGPSAGFCNIPSPPPRPAAGPDPAAISDAAPACSCLEDPAARAHRCSLFLPDAVVVREIPWPIEAGREFQVRWTVIPLTTNPRLPVVTESLPPGFSPGGSHELEFGDGLEPMKPVTRTIPAAAGEKPDLEGWRIDYRWPQARGSDD